MFIEKNKSVNNLKRTERYCLGDVSIQGQKKKKRLWDFKMRTTSYLTDVSRKEGIYLVT